MDQPSSPKRRHILSSFNQQIDQDRRLPADDPPPRYSSTSTRANDTSREHRRRRRACSSEQEQAFPSADRSKPPGDRAEADPENQRSEEADATRPRVKKLRLKSESSRRRRRQDAEDNGVEKRRSRDGDRHSDRDSYRSHHRSHRHHRRRSRSPTPENPHQEPPLDPDAAFRESLFDALADDEGAAYWEGVYGQPLHIYNDRHQSGGAEAQGPLERMTDDEYAAWVREQMWAKTHQGLLEEKARRDAARAEQAAQRKSEDRRRREDRKLQRDVERSLQAGEERRARRTRREAWQCYVAAWSGWDNSVDAIPWPAGRRPAADETGEQAVREFFVRALEEDEYVGADAAQRAKALKEERVRWHPDKIQQRLGGEVAPEVMRDATMIFRVLDKLWTEARQDK